MTELKRPVMTTPRDVYTRRATPQDQGEILKFTLDEAMDAEGRVESVEVIERAISRALHSPKDTAHYFVACRRVDADQDELLGHVSVTREWSDWNDAHYVWITSMYVKPSSRGQGVMGALIEEVDEYARSIGSPEVRIYVHQDNERGGRAWRREGFVETSYWMGHRRVSPKSELL